MEQGELAGEEPHLFARELQAHARSKLSARAGDRERTRAPIADVDAVEAFGEIAVDADDEIERRIDVEERPGREDRDDASIAVQMSATRTGSTKSGMEIALRTAVARGRSGVGPDPR